jgi:TetR/AcrR family transcriptional repressor of nem operon
MRYTKDHKLRTRRRIVEQSARGLRTHGAQGVGLADLMRMAGLTHGGFYCHFESRDELVAEAVIYGMDQTVKSWLDRFSQIPPERRCEAIIDDYLTAKHRDNPGKGCVLPALAADIARGGLDVRRAFATGLEQMIDVIAIASPSRAGSSQRETAIAILAMLMGIVSLARACADRELSDEILASGRDAMRRHFVQAH